MQICTRYAMIIDEHLFVESNYMGERLEGNLTERLRELREEHGYKSRNKLADVIGIDRTTYSRIENGSTKTISSDILIKLAELYGVSADYILGLSNTPEKTYDDINTLGLSIEAAKNLCSNSVDARVVNELLLNKKFAMVTKLLAAYYTAVANKTYESKNKALDYNYGLLMSMVSDGMLPGNIEMKKLAENIKAQKEPTTQAEIEKIKNTFMSAVKEIREKVIAEVETQAPVLDADFMEQFKKEINMTELAGMKTDDEKAAYIANVMAYAVGASTDVGIDKAEEMIPGFEILLKAIHDNTDK